MRAELEKDIAKWKKAFLDESNELAKRSTELNDLHDAYAILAEKYEAAIAAQAQQPTDLSKQLREYAADSGYSHNDYADTMLAAAAAIERLTASQAQQEPNKDVHEAIILLSAVFDAWENGTDCYDDFDGVSGSFIGKAFNLDDEIFNRCCDLLNRVNPPRNVSQAQQTESKPSIEDVQNLVDASESIMKWLVENVHRWNFKTYDRLHLATMRVKDSIPPAPEGGDKP